MNQKTGRVKSKHPIAKIIKWNKGKKFCSSRKVNHLHCKSARCSCKRIRSKPWECVINLGRPREWMASYKEKFYFWGRKKDRKKNLMLNLRENSLVWETNMTIFVSYSKERNLWGKLFKKKKINQLLGKKKSRDSLKSRDWWTKIIKIKSLNFMKKCSQLNKGL